MGLGPVAHNGDTPGLRPTAAAEQLSGHHGRSCAGRAVPRCAEAGSAYAAALMGVPPLRALGVALLSFLGKSSLL